VCGESQTRCHSIIMKTKTKNIPDGWEEVLLASIGSFFKGSAISKEQLSETGHNAVRYGELYTKHDFSIKIIYSFIPSEVVPLAKKIRYGDILFAGSGETIDEIGKSATYLLRKDAYAGGDIIILRPKNANSLFLSYCLNVGEARKKLCKFGQGQSVVHIYKKDLEGLKLHLPPIPEQNRIVAVLEIWDRAIERLTKKIEIKKKIKKGLMQELLTGKTRLPGFKDVWRMVSIGEVGKLISGGTPSKLQDKYWTGKIPWISSSDLIADNIRYLFIHRFITYEAVRQSATNIIPKRSVIVVSRVGVGKVAVNEVDLCTSQDFLSLIVGEDKNSPDYFAHLLIIELQRMLMSKQGTSIRGILKKDLQALALAVPKIKEQIAIACILNAADSEIFELTHKLSLLTDQKKYLLNNLITGTIRTPEALKVGT